jgi:hypothetical protein
LIASEENAANFFLYLAASLESQDQLMQDFTEWLKSNSEIIIFFLKAIALVRVNLSRFRRGAEQIT